MAEEEGDKQAAISSDEGINQKQWMQDSDLGAPMAPILLSDAEKSMLTDPRRERAIRTGPSKSLKRTEPKYHPSSWRQLGGDQFSPPDQRAEAERAMAMAKLYPEHRAHYTSIAGAHALGQRNLLTFEDIEAAEAPSFWENIGTLLEPFTTPQRALWYGAFKLGEFLPDPGTMFGDTVQDLVGIVGAPMLGLTTGVLQLPIMTWEAIFGEDKREDHYSSGKIPAEELTMSFTDMVENLYRDVSTGELSKQAELHMRPWLYGDWSSMPSPTGDMIIDSMISHEAAEHLSRNGSTRQLRKFGDWMSSDTGRLLFGVSLELIADPLWFAGPAKGANIIGHGDDAYRISGMLTKSSGKLKKLQVGPTSYSKVDFQHMFIDLYGAGKNSTPAKIADAEILLGHQAEIATAQVKLLKSEYALVEKALKTELPEDLRRAVRAIADAKLDTAKAEAASFQIKGAQGAAEKSKLFAKHESERIRLIAANPDKAKAWLNRQLKNLPKETKNFQKLADDIGKMISDASTIRAKGPKAVAKHVKPHGAWAVHIPFTTKEMYLLEKSPVRSATELMRKVGPVANMLDNYNYATLSDDFAKALQVNPNISALEAFGHNQAKLAAWTMGGTVQGLANIPLAGWDMFRRAFGTRFMQPMIQSMHHTAARQTGLVPVITFGGQTLQRIKRVHPKIWSEYQDGLTKMMEGYTGLETNLRNRILRIYEKANRTLSERRKKSAEEVKRLTALRSKASDPLVIADLNFRIDKAKMWGNSKEYSLKNIVDEAGSALEEGAGGLEKLSDDVRLVGDEALAIVKEIANDPTIAAGYAEVTQSLVEFARLSKGSNLEKANILANLKLVDEALSSINLTAEKATKKMRRAYIERLTELRTARSMIESINPEALSAAIIAATKITNETFPEDLFKQFVSIFGTEEAARSVLRGTAIAMGTADGHTAMRMFAEKITGDIPASKFGDPKELREAIGFGIRDYLSQLKSDSIRMQNAWKQGATDVRIGERQFFPGMKSDDFDALVDSIIEKETLSWKALIPANERGAFQTWAAKGDRPGESMLLRLADGAPEVAAGSEHWKAAYSFYHRSRALEEVKVTARKWAASGKKGTRQKVILSLESQRSKEEMYRIAEATEARGGVVSDRYMRPSRWRRKRKPTPEPEHVPVELIPDEDLYIPTPDELATEAAWDAEILKIREIVQGKRIFLDTTIDLSDPKAFHKPVKNSDGTVKKNREGEVITMLDRKLRAKFDQRMSVIGIPEAEFTKLLRDMASKTDLAKADRAKKQFLAYINDMYRADAPIVHPPAQNTKKVDLDIDLGTDLGVAQTLDRVLKEVDIQVGRALFRDADSVIIETREVPRVAPGKAKKRVRKKTSAAPTGEEYHLVSNELLRKEAELDRLNRTAAVTTNPEELAALNSEHVELMRETRDLQRRQKELAPEPVLDADGNLVPEKELKDVDDRVPEVEYTYAEPPDFTLHGGKYELTGRITTSKRFWPKLKRGETYYYYPKQLGPPNYTYLDGQSHIVAGKAVDLGLNDGRDYFIFKKNQRHTTKEGALKEGEEITGHHGQVDESRQADVLRDSTLMEKVKKGELEKDLQRGESEAIFERIVHRGEDLENQVVVPVVNKDEVLKPDFGEDIHYVQVRASKAKDAAKEKAKRVADAKKLFEEGPDFAEYQKVTAELKEKRKFLNTHLTPAVDKIHRRISKLEIEINNATGSPKELKTLNKRLSEARDQLKLQEEQVTKYRTDNIEPLIARQKKLAPPPVEGKFVDVGGARRVVGHDVEVQSLLEKEFFAYKDSDNYWYIVEVESGARVSKGQSVESALETVEARVLEKGKQYHLDILAKQPSLWGFGEKQVHKSFIKKEEWLVKDVASGITRGKGATREAAIEAAKNKDFSWQIPAAHEKPEYVPVVKLAGAADHVETPWQIKIHRLGKPKGEIFGGTVLLARAPKRAGKPLMPATKRKIEAARDNGGKFIVGDSVKLDKALISYLDEIGANYTVYGPSYTLGGPRVLDRVREGRLQIPLRPLRLETRAAIEETGRRHRNYVVRTDKLSGELPPPRVSRATPASPFNPISRTESLDLRVKGNLKHQTDRVVNGIDDIGVAIQKEFITWKETNIKNINPRVYSETHTPEGLLFSVSKVLERLSGANRTNPFPDAGSVENLELLLEALHSYASGLGKTFKPSTALHNKAIALYEGLTRVGKPIGGKKYGPLGPFHDHFVQILKGLTLGGENGSATIRAALRKIKKKYGKDIELALPPVGDAVRMPLGPKGMGSVSELRIQRIRELGDDAIMDALGAMVVKDGINDTHVRAMLTNIYKRSNAKKTISETTEATLKADLTSIKESMLDLSRTTFAKVDGKMARGDIAREIFASARKEGKIITNKKGELSKEFLEKRKELSDRLHKHIEPKGVDRTVEGWEQKMFADFTALAQKHGLSRQDQLFAAFSVLREMPRGLPPAMMKNLTKKYPQVIGRRFGDVEDDLVPVMEELESLIKFYELEYADKVWDLVRNPEEMMERWGVVDFVPHPFHAGTDEIDIQLSMAGKTNLGSGRGFQEMFFRDIDAAKGRKIAGSINEINAFNSAKEGATNLISLDPSLLWGRYAQVNHAITNDTFVQTLISTRVIRGLRVGDKSLATDFGIELNRLDGVPKTVEELAVELDMVPLFQRDVATEELSRFLESTLDELLGANASVEGAAGRKEVGDLLESVAAAVDKAPEKGFATWIKSSKNINALRKIEQTALRLRAAQAANGQELFNARRRYQELLSPDLAKKIEDWDSTEGAKLMNALPEEQFNAARKKALREIETSVSRKAWEDVSEEMNALRHSLTPNAPKTTGMHLSAYFDPDVGLWEMYIPRAVYQSMHEVINMDPKAHGLVGTALERFNNWWKTRVTVIAIAFSTRNALANNVTMAFDLGPGGVLSPRTQLKGLQLANAARWHDEFGSIAKAWEVISTPLAKGATAADKAKRANRLLGFTTGRLKKLLDEGVQVTDDLWMPVDELLDRLNRTGVISPAYTQVVDINAMEQAMAKMYLHGGALADGTTAARVKQYMSNIEDALLVTVPTMMTGGVPVAMTKNVGAQFARGIENQARIFNFLANIKKTNNWDDAVSHVNKFLFNYGDLTQVQKRWMRLLLPWFTWNQKNFMLQLDLMQKSPALFASFHRMMVDGLPQAMEASQAESIGERFVDYDPLSKERLSRRETHYMHTIQVPLPSLENFALGNIPVPAFKRGKKGTVPWQTFDMQWGKLGKDYFPRMKNAQVQGFGLPQEAFVNNLSLLMTAADVRNWPWMPLPGDLGKQQRARSFSSRSRWIRMMGETHALLRLAAEIGSSQHSYFNKPINELTDGRLVAETLDGIRKVPFVGDTVADIMAERTGLKGYTVYDKWSGGWKEFLRVDGSANHILGTLPWARSLRDAAAMTDQFLLSRSIPFEQLAAEGIVGEFGEVAPLYSVIDALSGVRIKQVDPKMMTSYGNLRTEKQLQKYLESRGLLKSFENSYVPYKY